MARVIGLTGGIASGKSTIARMLVELGARVIDADRLAREVVEPGQPALAEIVERFGRDVLTADGTLDRARLGAIVFADPEARKDLEAITHPRIREASARRIAEFVTEGAEVIIYEAPLIVEKKIYEQPWMEALIVVSVPAEVQVARLMARDQLGEDESRARLAAQLPLGDKVAVADYVIDNSRSTAETRAQVHALWPRLNQRPGPGETS